MISGLCVATKAFRMQRKYAQAEPLYVDVLEIQLRLLGENHPDTLRNMNYMALLYVSQGKYAEAKPILTKVLEIRRRVLGPQHSESLDGMVTLGEVHLMQRDFVRAETVCREYLTILEEKARLYWGPAWRVIPPAHRQLVSQAGKRIVQLYQRWGKPEKAAEWRVKLEMK
jgi:tetratricopeptide (TPR) repeat protein